MNAAASTTGVLLFSAFNVSSQFTWLDRTGKVVGLVGDVGDYSTFRVSPDGRRVAVEGDEAGSGLWLLDVERRGASRFAPNSTRAGFPLWSPDGRTIHSQPVLSMFARAKTKIKFHS